MSVPVGNYTARGAHRLRQPRRVLLTAASANPEAGFPVAGGTSIPTDQIQIQGTQGSSGNLTVPMTVNFVSPLVVTTSEQ